MDFLPIPAIISNPRSSSQRPSSVFLELFISYKTNKPHLGAKHSYHSSFLSLPCPYHQKLCPGPYKASVFPKTPGRDASIVLAMPPLIWWLKGSWRRERNPNVPRVPDSSASKTGAQKARQLLLAVIRVCYFSDSRCSVFWIKRNYPELIADFGTTTEARELFHATINEICTQISKNIRQLLDEFDWSSTIAGQIKQSHISFVLHFSFAASMELEKSKWATKLTTWILEAVATQVRNPSPNHSLHQR